MFSALRSVSLPVQRPMDVSRKSTKQVAPNIQDITRVGALRLHLILNGRTLSHRAQKSYLSKLARIVLPIFWLLKIMPRDMLSMSAIAGAAANSLARLVQV